MQRFYLYAERGLSRKRVSVWLYDGRLYIAHREALLARYAYRYDRRARRLRTVEAPQLYHTTYASPQLELWELDDAQWRKVLERPLRRSWSASRRGSSAGRLPVAARDRDGPRQSTPRLLSRPHSGR
jgi:hypothetical protein